MKVCGSLISTYVFWQVVGMNWIEVPPGKYNILSDAARRSQCQIEFSMRYVLLILISNSTSR